MSRNKTAGTLAAFAVVALMAGPAIAGKPMNVVEKRKAAEAMRQQLELQSAPKTMAEAAAGQSVTEDGFVQMEVPDELHNYMSVERDANGKLRVIETDGPPVEGLRSVEATNE